MRRFCLHEPHEEDGLEVVGKAVVQHPIQRVHPSLTRKLIHSTYTRHSSLI